MRSSLPLLLTAQLICGVGFADELDGTSSREKVLNELDATIVQTRILEPAGASSYVFDQALLHYLADGSRMLELQSISTEELTHRTVAVTVDPRTGLIEGVLQPSPPVEELRSYYAKLRPAPHSEHGPLLPEEPPHLCACPDSCSGTHVAFIKSIEPAFQTVAETNALGFWSRQENFDDTACSWISGGAAFCYANPHVNLPPPFDTHWFKALCTQSGPVGSDGNFFIYKLGGYYNWDFLDPNKRTDVLASVEIQLVPGVGVVTTLIYVDSGEASLLLNALTFSGGTNDCF